MLIRPSANAAVPGSHHAKHLPAIREAIRKANPEKLKSAFRRSIEGVKIATFEDVRRSEKCNFDEAKQNGLFSEKTIQNTERWFAEKMSPVTLAEGTDEFMYQVDSGFNPFKVFALHIDGKKIPFSIWQGLLRSGGNEAYGFAEQIVTNILDEQTPTFVLATGTHILERSIAFDDLAVLLPKERQGQWGEINAILQLSLYERGYRSSDAISAPQEHKLGGSTISFEYFRQPYKPLGLIHAENGIDMLGARPLGIDEARLARELAIFTAVHAEYYGLPREGRQLPVFYEPLDAKGNTVRDPRPINTANLGEFLRLYPLDEAIERSLVPNTVKRGDYPYRRD